jgi:hypothetical protein
MKTARSLRHQIHNWKTMCLCREEQAADMSLPSFIVQEVLNSTAFNSCWANACRNTPEHRVYRQKPVSTTRQRFDARENRRDVQNREAQKRASAGERSLHLQISGFMTIQQAQKEEDSREMMRLRVGWVFTSCFLCADHLLLGSAG